jgi:hypothetical protein
MREAVDSSRRGARLARVGAVLSAIFAIAAAAPAQAPRTSAPSVGAPKAPAYTTVTDPPPEEPAPAGPAKTTFPWRNLEGKFWQVVAAAPEDPRITDLREGTRGACATGMVEVAGRMKDDSGDYFGIDGLQQLTCKKWISREWPERCAEYDRAAWLERSKNLRTVPMHFCMDRFEYPNRLGENPIVLVDWYEANALCKREQKRLCTEDEWTFACEGEEARPYPNGYAREDVCVNDRTWREFKAFGRRDSEQTMLELDRLWQGEPSGSKPRCRSPFGVYDMTGNVDEWTRGTRPGERPSVLKGGYWGPVRTRCRPATRAHGETHMFYQQGLRCCADAPEGGR